MDKFVRSYMLFDYEYELIIKLLQSEKERLLKKEEFSQLKIEIENIEILIESLEKKFKE